MIEYKYIVVDDGQVLKQESFDKIEDALAYAKQGKLPFIFEYQVVEGELDPDTEELVWHWDDIWDSDEETIARINSRHAEPEVDESFNIEINKAPEGVEIRTSGDEASELMDFARAILGDNFEVFDQDFADIEFPREEEPEVVPAAEFDYAVEEQPSEDVSEVDPFEGTFDKIKSEEPSEVPVEESEVPAEESEKESEEQPVEEIPAEEIPEEEKELVAEIEKTPADESPKDMINGKLVDAKDPMESEVEVEKSEDIDECANADKLNKPLELNEAKKEDEEEIPEKFEDQMDLLAADEDEAIEAYDKIIDKVEDEHIANELDKIQTEEEAHKEFLELVKEDPEAVYEEPLEQEEVAEEGEEENKEEELEEDPQPEPLEEGISDDQFGKIESKLIEGADKWYSIDLEWEDEYDVFGISIDYDKKSESFSAYISVYHASEDNNAENVELHTDEDEYSAKSLKELYELLVDDFGKPFEDEFFRAASDAHLLEGLLEASSAEKRAFKFGGEDVGDYLDGKAIARVKDPHERARLIALKHLEKSGKLGDRASVSQELARKVDQADVAFEKKEVAMQKAGYAAEPDDLEECTTAEFVNEDMPFGGDPKLAAQAENDYPSDMLDAAADAYEEEQKAWEEAQAEEASLEAEVPPVKEDEWDFSDEEWPEPIDLEFLPREGEEIPLPGDEDVPPLEDEEDMSDDDFLEAFGKAMKERHDKKEEK